MTLEKMGKGIIFPFLFLFLFSVGGKVEAAVQVVDMYDPFGMVNGSARYVDYGSYDAYQIDVSGNRAVTVTFTTMNEDFTDIGSSKTMTAGQYGWTHFTGMGFNCNFPYIGELYDADGNLLVKVKLIVSGLTKPKCDMEGSDGDVDVGSGECDLCGIFDCPGWGQYMSKLDSIKNAIPPAPNWDVVSGKFSDAIVPRLVGETKVMLDGLLGRAPEPPSPPASLPTMPNLKETDDGGFKDKEPNMQDSGVKGFDSKDIKDQAPEVKYEEDDTGGFDLKEDPVDSLPDVVPGGDPGEYKRDPEMMPADPPETPKEEVGSPPTPEDGGGSPPIPEDGGGKPPVPEDGGSKPPVPGDGGGKPPIPGDGGGSPPIPGDGGGSPPIPGGGGNGPPSYMPKPKGG